MDTVSHKLFKKYFLLQRFFKKMESKDVASTKTQKADIFESVGLRGVHPIAKSRSAVCIIPQSQGYQLSQKTLRCASHCGEKLCGVLPTVESSSAVCCTPGSQAPRCAAHRGVKLCSVHHTAVSNCTPRSQNQNLRESLVALKGTIRCAAHHGVKFFELCD